MATEKEQLSFEFEARKTIKGYPELHWTGKRPFRSTFYYPAQQKKQYGAAQNGWLNKIFWGDNLQVMSHLLRELAERGKQYPNSKNIIARYTISLSRELRVFLPIG